MIKILINDADGCLCTTTNSIRSATAERRSQPQLLCGEPLLQSLAEDATDNFAGSSALESLFSVIEHEINQPLHAIVNFADASVYVLEETPAVLHPKLLGWLKQISEQAIRAAQVIRQARCFVDAFPISRVAVNINELVRECIDLVNSELRGQDVRLHCEFRDALPRVAADVVQIQLVIMNLVHNAVDAILKEPGVGHDLVIRTAVNANNVRVSIYNAGSGIVPGDGRQLSDLVFDKESAVPRLGLALSQSIVQSHGGCLWVEPEPDCGAALCFSLPALKEDTRNVYRRT